jgi:hypothetical protein
MVQALHLRGEMRVHLLDQRPRSVAQFPGDGKGAHRGTSVQRLEPRGAVAVTEHLRPDLSPLPSCPHRDPIERPSPVGEQSLPAGHERGEKESCRRPTENERTEDLLELGPEGDDAGGCQRFQAPEVVHAERHGPTVEAHVGHFEPGHLALAAAGEQDGREQGMGEVRRDRVHELRQGRGRRPRTLEQERGLVDLEVAVGAEECDRPT